LPKSFLYVSLYLCRSTINRHAGSGNVTPTLLEIAGREDANAILQLQRLAYQSEAELNQKSNSKEPLWA
jgi:hypothetical protein